MTKRLFFILSIIAIALIFASCGTRSGNNAKQNANTFDEGVVINGVRWATRNVDAPGTFTENPEDYGMLFQWNRRKEWSATDEDVEGWDNSTHSGTAWYAQNDPCPQGWRVPTHVELQSLNNAGSIWTRQNNVSGRFFGTAPNQIFLPAAGFRDRDSGAFYASGFSGNYWGSSVNNESDALWYLTFASPNSFVNYFYRSRSASANSIRCVAIN